MRPRPSTSSRRKTSAAPASTTLPEALRLAPNLQVARADSVQYAISARGFNNAIGNKLLVLIDGRTVYTPLFSGVFWDQQDVLLEDVERIEVISGPGATLWGANAVNGVINVITRSAADTTGALLSAAVPATTSAAARCATARTFGSGALRVYAKYSEFDHTLRGDGAEQPTTGTAARSAFAPTGVGERDAFTLQGDAYQGDSEHRGFVGPFELTEIEVSGANLLGRWKRAARERLRAAAAGLCRPFQARRRLVLSARPPTSSISISSTRCRATTHQRALGRRLSLRPRRHRPRLRHRSSCPTSRSLQWGNLFVQDEITAARRR